MTDYKISEDAAHVLALLIKAKKNVKNTHHIEVNPSKLKKIFNWEDSRMFNAVDYLNKKGWIEISYFASPTTTPDFLISNVAPHGIDLIESPEQFKKILNIEYKVVNFNIEKLLEVNPQLKASIFGWN